MSILDRVNLPINRISPYEPGKPIEDLAREFNIDPGDIIKLASNENALGASPKAVAAIKGAADTVFRYPDGNAWLLRKKLADRYGLTPDQIIIGNGSNEILELVGHCFMNPSTSAVFSRHSFLVYKLMVQLFGARMIEVPMTAALVHDIDEMIRRIAADTTVIFICNPNNPTGTMIDASSLIAALDRVPDDVLVVVDEAYAEVCLASMPDTIGRVGRQSNLLVCRTFSKGYGLAGLRLGYGIGPASIIQLLQKFRQPFNVNHIAQLAGVAALEDTEFVSTGLSLYRDERAYLERVCRELNLQFIPTTTNFMLVNVRDGAAVCRRLLKKGLIVRSMDAYELPEYIRVTFGKHDENVRFAEELKKAISNECVCNTQ